MTQLSPPHQIYRNNHRMFRADESVCSIYPLTFAQLRRGPMQHLRIASFAPSLTDYCCVRVLISAYFG